MATNNATNSRASQDLAGNTLLYNGGALGTPASGNLSNCTGYPGAATAASQAEQETGSSTSVYVSPGRQQYHASSAKAWVRFTGTGTVTVVASYNISSVTDNGIGDYTPNFTIGFSTANYCVVGNCSDNAYIHQDLTVPATGSCRILTSVSTTNAAIDVARAYCAFFGDQS